ADGSFTFTARVTDAWGVSGTKSLSMTVLKAPTVATSSPLPAGTVTAPYSQTLAVSDGKAPFTWSVSGGMLPPGLTLDPSGALTGTPTLDGAYSLTAQVADGAGANASKSLSITIAPAPVITTTSP